MISFFFFLLILLLYYISFLGTCKALHYDNDHHHLYHINDTPLKNRTIPFVDIVITVKTDIKYVRSCVNSLIRHAPDPRVLQQRIIFVDDGSPSVTLLYELELCHHEPNTFFCTRTNDNEKGYTWAVEKGMHFVVTKGHEESHAIVLLNSDTIVTEGWLVSMFETLVSKKNLMIVGPLSNAATWQSVPYLDHIDNTVPMGLGIDVIAKEIRHYAQKKNMTAVPITIINGFCFMFKREVLTYITGFDTKHFGPGYGEEVDFSLRSYKKGFQAQIIPNSYVFHTKTASFPSDEKKELNRKAHIVLDSKYKDILDDFKKKRLISRSKFNNVAKHVGYVYSQYSQRFNTIQLPSILFVIPANYGAKDFIRILRVVFYLRSYSIQVRVEAIDWHVGDISVTELLDVHFPDLSLADRMAVMGVHATDFAQVTRDAASEPSTPRALRLKADIVVAVSLEAVPAVLRICAVNDFSKPLYLLDDVSVTSLLLTPSDLTVDKFLTPSEINAFKKMNITLSMLSQSPLLVPFLANAPNQIRSYLSSSEGSIEDKSKDFSVNFIPPHVAHDVYYASPHDLKLKFTKHFGKGSKFNILVHVDSSTDANRLPVNIFSSLNEVLQKHRQASLSVLFTENGDSSNHILKITNAVQDAVRFISVNYSRPLKDLADVYRESDVFIDASSAQVGIREELLLEVMACGCIVALPPPSVAKSEHSLCKSNSANVEDDCYIIDLTSSESIVKKISLLLESPIVRKKLIARNVEAAREYSQEEASLVFLEQIGSKAAIILFGLDSSAFVSLFIAIVIVSVIAIGIAYLRPASNARKA